MHLKSGDCVISKSCPVAFLPFPLTTACKHSFYGVKSVVQGHIWNDQLTELIEKGSQKERPPLNLADKGDQININAWRAEL